MNTRLLKLARRHKGVRRWVVPGFENGITLLPASMTGQGWGPSVRWPFRDAQGDATRAVDLDRHRKLALSEIRSLLATVPRRQAKACK